jgi:hypothetical protein
MATCSCVYFSSAAPTAQTTYTAYGTLPHLSYLSRCKFQYQRHGNKQTSCSSRMLSASQALGMVLVAAYAMLTDEGIKSASPFGSDRLVRCIECLITVVRCWLALHARRQATVHVTHGAGTGGRPRGCPGGCMTFECMRGKMAVAPLCARSGAAPAARRALQALTLAVWPDAVVASPMPCAGCWMPAWGQPSQSSDRSRNAPRNMIATHVRAWIDHIKASRIALHRNKVQLTAPWPSSES